MTRALFRPAVAAGVFAILAGFGMASPAAAQSGTPPPKLDKPAVGASKKAVFELADDLDGLFAQLSRTRDKKRSQHIADRIWAEWRTSDSRSIDLLLHWAAGAMSRRDFPTALDLLDQAVVLRPRYAEGWNQRATLHFMMENFGKSISDIERVLALEPRHFGALSGLATIFERIERKDDALKVWYRALAVFPAMESAQSAVIRLEEELAGSRI